jgi:hypothetical protein
MKTTIIHATIAFLRTERAANVHAKDRRNLENQQTFLKN